MCRTEKPAVLFIRKFDCTHTVNRILRGIDFAHLGSIGVHAIGRDMRNGIPIPGWWSPVPRREASLILQSKLLILLAGIACLP